MATYAIGDLQGCYQKFVELTELIGFNASRDKLWLVGDIVNRGPDSLSILRALMKLDDAVLMVLGNHDLHLLQVAINSGFARSGDTLQPILEAPDRKVLLDWLRSQRLFYAEDEYALVHAGLLPDWTIDQAAILAREVESIIRGDHFEAFSRKMYGNQPDSWHGSLRGEDRWRVIINAMTRLRVCSPEGKMDFSYKGSAATIPEGLLPWFDAPNRASKNSTVVFGHWSALGLRMERNLIALDTGCLWGDCLTAVRLEDRKVFQVPCG